jgi:hypothetical protein
MKDNRRLDGLLGYYADASPDGSMVHVSIWKSEAAQLGGEEYDLSYLMPYIGLETEATSISGYNSGFVPGLLQTASYVRAILEAEKPPLDPGAIEQRIDTRSKRQDLLTQAEGPFVYCTVDEAVLRRPAGGTTTMRAQLARIVELADLPKVTLQVMPFDVGAHPGLDSNFTILKFDSSVVDDVVYEGAARNIHRESSTDLERYKRVCSRLQSIALDSEGLTVRVEKIAATYQDRFDLAKGL